MLLTVGYAAFSTNFSLKAKGNIIDTTNVEDLKKTVITNGDGLYVDEYETGRYVYRGSNPNNYLDVDGDIWRILSIENDNTLKIIKQESIVGMKFDNNYYRADSTYCIQSSYGSYGQNIDSKYGCNVWNKKDGEYISGSLKGTVTKDASLNTYLNEEFYNSLSDILKGEIVSHVFYVGPISISDVQTIEKGEQSEEWVGNVALINISDYMKASMVLNCSFAEKTCSTDNYIYDDLVLPALSKYTSFWTLGRATGNSLILYDLYEGRVNSSFAKNSYGTNPVVYLKDSILFSGEGTKENPYVIIN